MLKHYLRILALILLCSLAKAQVPAIWPSDSLQLTLKMDTILAAINAKWNGTHYCTKYSGNLLLANSNRGYSLFSQTPPSLPNAGYQSALYADINNMMNMYDSLGYTAIDITINYPLLVDSFPNKSYYLDFYKHVYQMARQHGFKITEECQATFADSVVGEYYMTQDILHYLFNDTLTEQRYLRDETQMMQTIIDSLTPDYLTMVTEPTTEQFNLFNLLSFAPDSNTAHVKYYLNHLVNPNHVPLGAGSGTWEDVKYIAQVAPLPTLDFVNVHIYPVINDFIDNEALIVDSLAHANNKKIVVGECWCSKQSVAEYQSANLLNGTELTQERDGFEYWEPIDTQFVRMMINLSQQGQIDVVSFFYSTAMFGQIPYLSSYNSLSLAQQIGIETRAQYDSLAAQHIGAIGLFTKNAIMGVCDTVAVNTGINSMTGAGTFSIYPNPGNDLIHVSGSSLQGELMIYSVTGTKVLNIFTSGQSRLDIDVSSLSSGLYFVSAGVGNSTKKLVISR